MHISKFSCTFVLNNDKNKNLKTMGKAISKSRTQVSVENGIKILNKAIKKGISLSEASRQSNFGRNYVSDIKARIAENYANKNVTKASYNEFKTLTKEYNKK